MWRHTHHLFSLSSKNSPKCSKLKLKSHTFTNKAPFLQLKVISVNVNVKSYSTSTSSNSSSSSNSNSCKLEAAPLVSRSLIKLGGADCLPFLQGLVTNDISHLDAKPSIFTLLLNHQGRILYDALLYRIADRDGDKNTVWIECDANLKTKLLGHLKLFKVRKAVEIQAEEELSPWVVYDPGHTNTNAGNQTQTTYVDVKASSKSKYELTDSCCEPLEKYSGKREPLPFKINPQGSVFHVGDPRLPELGWRVLIEKQKDKDVFPPDVRIKDSEEGYKALRYSLGVGEGAKEIVSGSSFPLESNGDFLHGISFHKGCYIGQELTARTHHTGVVRKRLMPFRLSNGNIEGDLETLQILSDKERPVGKIRGVHGPCGIALVRVEEALASLELKLEPGGDPITITKPLWWPIEASKEIASRK